SGFADIKVYNAQGQQMFNKRVDADSEKRVQIMLENNPPGLYIVQINHKGYPILKKLSKNEILVSFKLV
ncbi:MAG: T9SS type A sorting domain-containing protein, partial [Bacteroidales bacterium]|nr:T9SS type A sorting domain-containing protein [Bacteroidales bacterium]